MTPWTEDQPVARPLPTRRTTQTQNKSTQASMSLVGFEPTTPVFERAKTVHGLDGAATVIVFPRICLYQLNLTLNYFTKCQKNINFILIYKIQFLLYMQPWVGITYCSDYIRAEDRSSIPGKDSNVFLFHLIQTESAVTQFSYLSGYQGPFSAKQTGLGVKHTSHLHI
jgi:hypothetical protein